MQARKFNVQQRNFEIEVKSSVDVSIDQKEIESILNLYDVVYGHKADFSPFIRMLAQDKDSNPWLWKNLDHSSDCTKNRVVLAREGEKLVGYTSYIAREAKVNDSLVTIMQSNDSMVHPQARRMGLFKRIVETLNMETFLETGIDYFYSFPNNENPRTRNNQDFSTQLFGQIPFMIKRTGNPGQYDSDIILGPPKEILDIWSNMSDEFGFGIKKDADYIKGRYLTNPHNSFNYRLIGLNEGKEGLAVLKIFQDGEIVRGHIVDIISDNRQATKQLYEDSESYLINEHGISDISTFMYPGTHHYNVLRDLGYECKPWSTYFVLGTLNPEIKLDKPIVEGNAFIQMGANDIF